MMTVDHSIPAPRDDASASADKRVIGAWCAWLGALATNAEAALAAALAYKQLEGNARDSWLAALEQDAERLSVPRIAVFAPLLAVESDPDRRYRITKAMGPLDEEADAQGPTIGLTGVDADGVRIAVVIAPLYLDFVHVLACGYRLDQGFEWVRHDPIIRRESAPSESCELDGAKLEAAPLRSMIDELAHAVVAHRRSLRPLPEALCLFADLFGAQTTSASPSSDLG